MIGIFEKILLKKINHVSSISFDILETIAVTHLSIISENAEATETKFFANLDPTWSESQVTVVSANLENLEAGRDARIKYSH